MTVTKATKAPKRPRMIRLSHATEVVLHELIHRLALERGTPTSASSVIDELIQREGAARGYSGEGGR